ncbi:MAG: hypothetical protein ACRDJM_07500 [Actinomycetota bacterium]
MIPTVFLDWGLAFGAGTLFALAGRDEISRAARKTRTRAFRWGLAYLHLGVIAISVTLYLIDRDWMWMYWVDPRALPMGIEVLAFLLYEVCFVAGFFLAAELAPRGGIALAAATGAAISLLEVTARERLFRLDGFWLVTLAGVISLGTLVLLLRRIRTAP